MVIGLNNNLIQQIVLCDLIYFIFLINCLINKKMKEKERKKVYAYKKTGKVVTSLTPYLL